MQVWFNWKKNAKEANALIGWSAIPVCLGLKEFPGHGTVRAKTGRVLKKLEKLVTLIYSE